MNHNDSQHLQLIGVNGEKFCEIQHLGFADFFHHFYEKNNIH
jgi:hypothetical protein